MEDLEYLAREVMLARDPLLVENFVKIILFSRDNPDLRVLARGRLKMPFGSEEHLEWLADRYLRGREPKQLPTPGTVPDPALAAVMIHGYGVDERAINTQIDGHRWAMVAENVVGDLLERFIDSELDDDDWVWCAGEVVKSVDFIRPSRSVGLDWESLQIKNRDNSENSSSSAIRNGTDIQKWYRIKSKTGQTRWEVFPVGAVDFQFSEDRFQNFIVEYIGQLPEDD